EAVVNAVKAAEPVETVPGLHVAINPSGNNPIYTIRGIYSDYNYELLLLINGIPFKDIFAGNRSDAWGGMPVNAIKRIEVIRGPGSALYGANAFSGIINIITKTKDDIDGTEIGARLGSFDTQDAWVLHGANWSGFDVALTIEYHKTDGQRELIDIDAQTQLDKIEGTNASLAPGPVNTSQDSLDTRLDISKDHWQLRAGYQGRKSGVGVGAVSALDPYYNNTDDRFNVDLTYHNPEFTKNLDITAQVSYLDMDTSFDGQTFWPVGNASFPYGFQVNAGVANRQTRIEISSLYTGFSKHIVRTGIGYHYADFHKNHISMNFGASPNSEFIDFTDTDGVFAREADRRNWHTFIQDSWHFLPDWELTAGLRYDEYSDFGNTTNPRLALVWQARQDLTTKLLYGQAFRAPTFQQMSDTDTNPLALGNPNLEPETIETWELAFDYRVTKTLHFAMNIFSYDITDKIVLLTEPNSATYQLRYQNMGRQKGQGVEFETRWKITNKSSLLFNYAFQNSIDKDNDHEIGFAPQHQAYLRTDWLLFPDWFLNTQINWVGERGRAFGDPRENLSDYTTMDLTLRQKNKNQPWGFAVSVRNIFDEDAREPTTGPNNSGVINIPNDFPLAGRRYFLEFRYYF
ncbi:MAG TPA: TonB-dependent receptor, partial [bacterium (Candidatus Stahlbacteria)]|nr:TonB-dependent receptor [Candidatus Stahlbacteria bacterium]